MEGSYVHVPHASKVPDGVQDKGGISGPDGCLQMLCCHVGNGRSPIGIEHQREEGECKAMEDLKEITLTDNILGQTTHVSTQADPSVPKELALFLKCNRDVFAWSYKDMPGISSSTMVHKLNVCPPVPPAQ